MKILRILFVLILFLGPSCAKRIDLLTFEPRVSRARKETDAAIDRRCALVALASVSYGLPNETWDRASGNSDDPPRKFPQQRLPDNPPLQTFPRLTAPYFADGAYQECTRFWYVPVIFDTSRETVRRSDVDISRRHPADALAYWLQPVVFYATPYDVESKDPEPDYSSPLLMRAPVAILKARELLGYTQTKELLRSWQTAVVLKFARRNEMEEQPTAVPPGFYWLRIVPKFSSNPPARDASPAAMINTGNLPEVLSRLEKPPAGKQSDERDLAVEVFGPGRVDCERDWLSKNLKCSHPFKHFWPELHDLQQLHDKAINGGGSGKEWHRFRLALKSFYTEDRSPAPVVLDDGRGPFSFVIAGDVQNSRDISGFRRFLEAASVSMRAEEYKAKTQDPLKKELSAGRSTVRFVIIDGDLADAQASSDPVKLVTNVFGLYPPISPYEEEYKALAGTIRAAKVPVVAVPGNHDASVGYAGVLNNVIQSFGRNRATDAANKFVPVLFKLPRPPSVDKTPTFKPMFDGLGEWRYAMGPTSYAFQFRGHTFVGLNSSGMTQRERASVGAVFVNWGGGIEPRDVEWMHVALDVLPNVEPCATESSLDASFVDCLHTKHPDKKHQFLYMHHDPRAGTPQQALGDVDRYGIYDNIDNFASFITFGHFGLGFSPEWDAWVPVVTPLGHHGSRFIDDLLNGQGRLQEEWMRRSFDPRGNGYKNTDAYGAKYLIDTIDEELAADPKSGGGLTHVFFAHNDVPLGPGEWVHTRDGNVVFPELRKGDWSEGREYHCWTSRPPLPIKPVLTSLFKVKNDEPPDWAKAIQVVGKNAWVFRLDDISMPHEPHGFHVFTVGPGSEVRSKWIPLDP